MKRRYLLSALGTFAITPIFFSTLFADMQDEQQPGKLNRSEDDWRRILSKEQFDVLRKEGTERPWTSPLNDEKRKGTYVCAGCDQALFTSEMKYDSGTGWPSFYTVIDGSIETKRDSILFIPRTEYHCSRCGGHHGHVFKDGPKPTGLRYCNNGVALKFVPDTA